MAGGSTGGVIGGSALATGGLVLVGGAATGTIVYYGATATMAEMDESAAYHTEWQAVHDSNLALMNHPRVLSLAGRYTAGGGHGPGDGGDDCPRQWRDARAYCSELASMPRSSREWKHYLQLWGGNYERCVRGQVQERCGGSLIR